MQLKKSVLVLPSLTSQNDLFYSFRLSELTLSVKLLRSLVCSSVGNVRPWT